MKPETYKEIKEKLEKFKRSIPYFEAKVKTRNKKEMKLQKLIGTTSILIGIFFILNSFSGITGFVIAESVGIGISGIFGLVLIIGGALVFMSGRTLDNYFEKRIKEITKHARTDEWIAQWEHKDVQDKLKDKGYNLRGPEGHHGGMTGPEIRHLNIQGYNERGVPIKKHLFITPDINDSHLFETYKEDKVKKPVSKKDIKQYEKSLKRQDKIIPRQDVFTKSSYNPRKRFLKYS